MYLGLLCVIFIVFVALIALDSNTERNELTPTPVEVLFEEKIVSDPLDLSFSTEPLYPKGFMPFSSSNLPVLNQISKSDEHQYQIKQCVEINCPHAALTLPHFSGEDEKNRLCSSSPWPVVCQNANDLPWAFSRNTTYNLFGISNGFVSSAYCHRDLPGMPFNPKAVFHLSIWTFANCGNDAPPYMKDRSKVVDFDVLASPLGNSYPGAVGHFVVQTLPRILFLLDYIPAGTKLLVPVNDFTTNFLQSLIALGKITHEQIVPWKEQYIYMGRKLYIVDTQPYGQVPEMPCTLQLVRKFYDKHMKKEPCKYRYPIYIKRGRDKARWIENDDAIITAIEKRFHMNPKIFTAEGPILNHVELFQCASVIIGPHGAGMFNMLWTPEDTIVVEIGYNDHTDMAFPPMYWHIAAMLKKPYYVMIADGAYGTSIRVNVNQFEKLLNTIP